MIINTSKQLESIDSIKVNAFFTNQDKYSNSNIVKVVTKEDLQKKSISIKDVINDSDLNLDSKKITNSENPEILIAGCGTGQHAITTASKYKKSKILALDLSFKSLSYAKRKGKYMKQKGVTLPKI